FVLNLPWNTLGGIRAALSKTSTLMFVAVSALVHRIARDDVTSPLATPSGKVTCAIAGAAKANIARTSAPGIHILLTLPSKPPEVGQARASATIRQRRGL